MPVPPIVRVDRDCHPVRARRGRPSALLVIAGGHVRPILFSEELFINLFRKGRFPHKYVNLFFVLVMIKDELPIK
jgi:hypothetical protein